VVGQESKKQNRPVHGSTGEQALGVVSVMPENLGKDRMCTKLVLLRRGTSGARRLRK
jgi:hypothetical protein